MLCLPSPLLPPRGLDVTAVLLFDLDAGLDGILVLLLVLLSDFILPYLNVTKDIMGGQVKQRLKTLS